MGKINHGLLSQGFHLFKQHKLRTIIINFLLQQTEKNVYLEVMHRCIIITNIVLKERDFSEKSKYLYTNRQTAEENTSHYATAI